VADHLNRKPRVDKTTGDNAWGVAVTRGENADAVINNIHIRIIQLSHLGIRIRIHTRVICLLSASVGLLRLLNAIIIRYHYMR
jgi:hypothetical protein